MRALDLFMQESDGALPLSGQIPDLTTTTEQYVLLQQAYQSKARADLDKFTGVLQGVLQVCIVIAIFLSCVACLFNQFCGLLLYVRSIM